MEPAPLFQDNILYKNLFLHANDAMFLYNFEDRIIDVNQKACEIYGFEREELIGADLFQIKPFGRQTEHSRSRIQWELDTYGGTSFETVDRCKDGSEIIVEVTNSVFEYKNQSYIFSIARDKTGERRSRDRLLRSESVMQSIMESTYGINIWAVDSEVRYTFFNAAHRANMKNVWGEDIEVGACLLDYIKDQEYRKKVEGNYQDLLHGKEVHSVDRLVYPDGSVHYVENSAYPIREENGSVSGATVFTTDITKRVLAEQELKQTLALQRSIMNSPSHIIIYSVDSDFRYIFFNHAHRKAMKQIWKVEPHLGDRILELISDPEYRENVRKEYQRVITGGEQIIRTNSYTDREGKVRHYQHITAPILDHEGNRIGITFFVLDITDRIEAEEQIRHSLEEKKVLLREVHHRVKNNLQIISSMLAMQIDANESESLRLQLREGQNRINTMALIHDQLYQSHTLARIEIRDYIRSLVSYIVDSFKKKGTQVRTAFFLCDGELDLDQAIPLGLIINEAVSNAMKYAFPGRKEGTITIRVELEGEGSRVLQIEDDGIGLPEGFDRNSLSTLGMQMVYALADQLQGELRVESNHGVRLALRF
ncbi:MAG: PAS domain S-box protein [Spirochaetales bacterium]|nr:PAS domain S-box protein [Spirochaetales bacterium]MCF7938317.1 PAS domain S-box protein [Spirochaetales bacterium]